MGARDRRRRPRACLRSLSAIWRRARLFKLHRAEHCAGRQQRQWADLGAFEGAASLLHRAIRSADRGGSGGPANGLCVVAAEQQARHIGRAVAGLRAELVVLVGRAWTGRSRPAGADGARSGRLRWVQPRRGVLRCRLARCRADVQLGAGESQCGAGIVAGGRGHSRSGGQRLFWLDCVRAPRNGEPSGERLCEPFVRWRADVGQSAAGCVERAARL